MTKAELSDYRVVESGGFRSHPRWPWLHVGADGSVWDDSLKRYRKQNTRNDGYKTLQVEGEKRLVHRMVIEAWFGLEAFSEGDVTRHRAGNRTWNSVYQLTVGSYQDNRRDRVRHENNGRDGVCNRGHLKAGDNLVPSALKRGRHQCRSCDRATSKAADLKRSHGIEATPEQVQAWSDEQFAMIVGNAVGTLAFAVQATAESPQLFAV